MRRQSATNLVKPHVCRRLRVWPTSSRPRAAAARSAPQRRGADAVGTVGGLSSGGLSGLYYLGHVSGASSSVAGQPQLVGSRGAWRAARGQSLVARDRHLRSAVASDATALLRTAG